MPQKYLFNMEWSDGVSFSPVLVQSEQGADRCVYTLHVDGYPFSETCFTEGVKQ